MGRVRRFHSFENRRRPVGISHPITHARIRQHTETVFVPGSKLVEALRMTPQFARGCESCTVRVDDRHAYFVAGGNRIQAVQEFASPIRRLVTIMRFCEQDGGASIEIEVMGLACDIPAGLRWLSEACVRLISRASLIDRRLRGGYMISRRLRRPRHNKNGG
ncbi:MAG TPA: hypothetical protein VKE70_26115 [Candidatus Solibacter sp.]|nr:hypothetical protein [Candidatus Solibacter sp.]